MGLPSRSIGTPSIVWKPPSLCALAQITRHTQARHMNGTALEQRKPCNRPPFRLYRDNSDMFGEFRRETIGFCKKELSVDLSRNGGFNGLAKSGCRFNEPLQHRFEIERRFADYLQNVGGCSELPQRFVALALSSRTVSGARSPNASA
jgi:hypothetical protein